MKRQWWTLTIACIAIFMLLLDITVVNVALPVIREGLNANFEDLQWVIDSYAVTLAAFLLTSGAIADVRGRKLIFAWGLIVFTLASAVCGFANSALMLNLARGVQGVGGAMMFSTSLALIAQEFEGPERGVAFGVFGAVMGGAVAVGPLLGGVITTGIGWRWIFFVNVPVGLVALVLTVRHVRESISVEGRSIDWPGLTTFSCSLFALVFALVRGNESGWSSPEIVGLLAGATMLLCAFVVCELRSDQPMMDLGLFRRPAFTGVSIASLALGASAFSLFLYLILYLQTVLGYSALETGLRFVPITFAAFLVAPVVGRLTVRVPARLLLGSGLLLCSLSLIAMTRLRVAAGWGVLVPGFVLLGVGIGIVGPALASTALGVVPGSRSGFASGANSTFRQVGIATGVAGLGAIFQHELDTHAARALLLSGYAREIGAAVHVPLSRLLEVGQTRQLTRLMSPAAHIALVQAYRVGFADALKVILMIGACVGLGGAVCAFAMVRSEDFVEAGAPERVADRESRVPA
jgi:EmrB/QacA subfamily drug resistance transporter